ncbi:MAG: OmpA family protein [Bacteroidia bacterium]
MKKAISILSLLFAVLQIVCAQRVIKQELNGNWQGILKQAESEKINNYAYWMQLTVKGDSVFGIARTEAANTPYYAIIEIKGKVIANKIQFVQRKIINANTRPTANWCLINGELLYDSKNNSLAGNWSSTTVNCTSGGMLLYKVPKEINVDKTIANNYVKMNELESRLQKEEAVDGYKIILSKLTFGKNSSAINTDAMTEINSMYALLSQHTMISITIQGHTDNTGDDDLNMKLSYLRAKEVYTTLLRKGIDKNRIFYEGYGKSRPITSNDTEVGKLNNRRVEIEIKLLK